jgi:hypothetical protein
VGQDAILRRVVNPPNFAPIANQITEGMISSVNPFHLVWTSLQRLFRKA